MSFLIILCLVPAVTLVMMANAGPNGLSRLLLAVAVLSGALEAVSSLGVFLGVAVMVLIVGVVLPVGTFVVFLAGNLDAVRAVSRRFPDEPWEEIRPSGLIGEFVVFYRDFFNCFWPVTPSTGEG